MNRLSCVILCIGALIGGGCARHEMIMGLYDVPRRALSEVAAGGFNVVTLASGETNRLRYLEEAQRSGIKTIVWPQLKTAAGRQETARLDDHPAVLAWYLEDEPDLNMISPDLLRDRRRRLRRVAQKPAWVVVASGAAIEKYRETADLLVVDSYPIAWAPLAVVSREMRTARLAARDRPFVALLQAFDWSAYPELLRTDRPQRPPTFEEMRCMAFLSLFQGARGLLFYTYQAGAWNIADRPAVWESLTNTVAEVRRLAPIFDHRVSWWPAQTRYEGPADDAHNELHEGRIALALFRVPRKRGDILPGYYLVAINTSPDTVAFSFRLPFRGAADVSTYCASSEISARDGWISKLYAPYEVCVLGPIDRPLEKKPLP